MGTIFDLPFTLLLHVWNFLTRHQRLRSRLVCTYFASVGGHTMENSRCFPEDLTVEISEAFPKLRDFHVRTRAALQHLVQTLGTTRVGHVHSLSFATVVPLDLLVLFRNLKRVRLGTICKDEMAWLTGIGHQLTELSFSQSKVVFSGKPFPNLQRLVVGHNVDDAAVSSFAQYCPHLCEIDFGRSDISDSAMSQLLSRCLELSALTNISYANKALLANVQKMPKLRVIRDYLGTVSQLCALIEAGFRPHTLDMSFSQPLSDLEMRSLRLCSKHVKELHLFFPLQRQAPSVTLRQLSPIFGQTLQKIIFENGECDNSLQMMQGYSNLRILHGPFSESIGFACTKLVELHVRIDNHFPDHALEQLGSQLIYLKKLDVGVYRAQTLTVMSQVEQVCSSPNMFSGLEHLHVSLPGDGKGQRIKHDWVSHLKELAKRHRPALFVTE
jgi:hypothetical protein